MSMKLIAAAVVLLTGFALASLFPSPDKEHSEERTAAVGVALRRVPAERDGLAVPPTSRTPVPQLADSARTVRAIPSGGAVRSTAATGGLREPPPMSATYARDVVHQVMDGDTLPALAARYLGNAALADQIAAANRVADPLPIGIILRIPPAGQVDQSQLANAAERFKDAQTRLVPIAPPPVVADNHAR